MSPLAVELITAHLIMGFVSSRQRAQASRPFPHPQDFARPHDASIQAR